ncbi:MAG TPA: type II toxin-antitoxin system VapC family toxin [Candidatus Bathyarchaeia archaeon]
MDTSFLIDLLRENPAAEKKFQYYTENYEPLTTTPINAAELFKGAYSAKEKRSEVGKARGILEYLELLDMSIPVCETYGRLVSELRSKGAPIGDLDTLIASTAIVHRQILVTRNKGHFDRVPGLVVESW